MYLISFKLHGVFDNLYNCEFKVYLQRLGISVSNLSPLIQWNIAIAFQSVLPSAGLFEVFKTHIKRFKIYVIVETLETLLIENFMRIYLQKFIL